MSDKSTTVSVGNKDHGGLKFEGRSDTLLQTACYLREAIGSDPSCPNYISDFIFSLEMECQEQGLMDDHFNVIKETV